jgi:hypothetical protein
MTTYALLELGDDGRVEMALVTSSDPFRGRLTFEPLSRVASGTDRGQFSTFEIGRFSIDVAVMPELRERK